MRSARGLTVSVLCCMFLLCGITAYADTHWANIAGSDTPPYASYAAGAHQIQDAIDACDALDTVKIASGLYHPDTTIFLKDSLAILGAGRDSTIIHPLYNANLDQPSIIMHMHGSSGETGGELTIRGCRFMDILSGPDYYALRAGIVIFFQSTGSILIADNSFDGLKHSVFIHEAKATISGNYINCGHTGIMLGSYGPYEVANNIITGSGDLDFGIMEAVFLVAR